MPEENLPKRGEVEPSDLYIMLSSTVRYSLGRQTYMTALAWELVVRYEAQLTRAEVLKIRGEIQAELDRAERHGKTVGSDIDHDCWKQGVRALDHVLAKRI